MSKMINFPTADCLRLFSVPGIGPNRYRNLITKFGTPGDVLTASVQELKRTEGVDEKTAKNIKTKSDDTFVDQQLKLLERSGTKIVTLWDPSYPEQLKKIDDAPPILWVKGQLTPEDDHSIAIVGTRNVTEYGKIVSEKICWELSKKKISVISGLAYGVDTTAHSATVAAKGRTIAVLGSGVDVIYPAANKKLAEVIVTSGALISENPLQAKPDAPNFPKRNRIISGMSLATIVIEADVESGAIITAATAISQGRPVFAVPGNINSPKSRGTNALIKKGEARLFQTVDDVLEYLSAKIHTPEIEENKPLPALSEMENKIYQMLSHQPYHIDHITSACSFSTAETLGALLTLELLGLVKQTPGKSFIRI